MSELISRADANQAVVELLGERIGRALADLDQLDRRARDRKDRTHAGECWRIHVGCLAARIRATLTGEDATEPPPPERTTDEEDPNPVHP